MARQAYLEYGLDEIWMIPTGNSPHKDATRMTPGALRLSMLREAIEAEASTDPFLRVCAVEIDSAEKSYTYRTLQHLCERYPMHQFYFLMGADSLDYFDKWRHPEIICSCAVILAVNRKGFTEEDMERKVRRMQSLFPADIRIVHGECFDAASHEIRDRIARGEDCSDVLTDAVIAFIRRHRLYENRRE